MKFVLAVALLCIGAVAAQTQAPHSQGKALYETLEKRASALLDNVKKTLEVLRHEGNWHLAGSLEHQAVVIEALALDLKKTIADSTKTDFPLHKIHVIEEDLLFLENRVSEEIIIINHFRDGHHHHNGDTGAQLIARGQKLVKDAKDAVAKFPRAKETREIESEVIVIDALIKTIQAKPAPTAAELKKDEEELARHEKTLAQLIEKATHRGN